MGIRATDDPAAMTFALPMRVKWLSRPEHGRWSFLVDRDGKKYVVKRTRYSDRERLLKRKVFGPIVRDMLPRIEHARENGCAVIQRMLHVVEFPATVDGRACLEIWTVSEYVEGRPLNSLPDRHDFKGRIAVLLSEMARHGVFQSDIHYGNFILSDDGVLHGIDIRMTNSPFLVSVARVAYKCKRALGVPLPTTGFTLAEKLAAFVGGKLYDAFGTPRKLK